MKERIPQPGERYRNFKDELYQVITVAMHSETEEELVIYQALYDDFAVYAKPLALFMKEVDRKQYPDVQQKNCLEKAESNRETAKTESELPKKQTVLPDRTKVLLGFLDCESSEEKLEYLRRMKKYIDDRMMNDISFALDIVIEEGELDDRIRTLENCLKTFCRYEGGKRLR